MWDAINCPKMVVIGRNFGMIKIESKISATKSFGQREYYLFHENDFFLVKCFVFWVHYKMVVIERNFGMMKI